MSEMEIKTVIRALCRAMNRVHGIDAVPSIAVSAGHANKKLLKRAIDKRCT
jgi:hypothetical protein